MATDSPSTDCCPRLAPALFWRRNGSAPERVVAEAVAAATANSRRLFRSAG